jgi:hypothetical protein
VPRHIERTEKNEERAPMQHENLRSANDFRTAVPMYEETVELGASADEVWGELSAGDHRFLPGTRVDWITEPPHGVGTLRVMSFGPIHLRSRYYAWEEANRYKAFYLENPPLGMRDLIEEFRVTPRGSGSSFSYRLSVIPKPVVRPILPLLSAYITFAMRSWHLRFFRRRFRGAPAAEGKRHRLGRRRGPAA